MLRTLIRWGVTTLTRRGGSGGETPIQQISFMDKGQDAVPWLPYGLAASVPPEKLAVVLAMLANSDSSVFLPGSPGEDPELAETEVALYHPPTGSKLHFLANGDALVEAQGQRILLSAAGVTITPASGLPVTVDGDLVVTGDVGAASAGIVGPATVGGTLGVTGATTLGAVTAGGKDIGATHTHGGSPTAPTGPVSNTGVPV